MSANNYINVQKSEDNKTWEVWILDADTDEGYPETDGFKTRAEALEHAVDNVYGTEYGVYAEQETES